MARRQPLSLSIPRRVGGTEVPKHVVFVAEYPQTPSGKVKKFELRALMMASLDLDADRR